MDEILQKSLDSLKQAIMKKELNEDVEKAKTMFGIVIPNVEHRIKFEKTFGDKAKYVQHKGIDYYLIPKKMYKYFSKILTDLKIDYYRDW